MARATLYCTTEEETMTKSWILVAALVLLAPAHDAVAGDAPYALELDAFVTETYSCPTVIVDTTPIDFGATIADSLRAEDLVSEPVILDWKAPKISPVFSNNRKRSGIHPRVLLRLLVSPEGRVARAVVLESNDDLYADMCRDTSFNFRFEPARTKDGPTWAWVHAPFELDAQ
jgi:hypothetical protein